MNYILREMTSSDKEKVLENCGVRESDRLLRHRHMERLCQGWAVDENIGSYLFRTLRQGDPKEDIRQDYYFFFRGRNYYIATNGAWPLVVTYDKSGVAPDLRPVFECCLHSAFEAHGLYGFIDKEESVFEISIFGR